jgi:hypothetical protein
LGEPPVRKTLRCRHCGWTLATHEAAAGKAFNERVAAEQAEPGAGGSLAGGNRKRARERTHRRPVCDDFQKRRRRRRAR